MEEGRENCGRGEMDGVCEIDVFGICTLFAQMLGILQTTV